MKPLTNTAKQWVWFILLWFCGLAATALLSYGIRWILRL